MSKSEYIVYLDSESKSIVYIGSSCDAISECGCGLTVPPDLVMADKKGVVCAR